MSRRLNGTHCSIVTVGRFTGVFIGLVALCSLPTQAHAQSYLGQVWAQLQAHYSFLSDMGDLELENYVIGKLDDNQSDTWEFNLNGNRQYFITAACDEDCSDLDIVVTDPTGREVARDTETDDAPVVEFIPKMSGVHRIQIGMYECSSEPCYFGFGLFKR